MWCMIFNFIANIMYITDVSVLRVGVIENSVYSYAVVSLMQQEQEDMLEKSSAEGQQSKKESGDGKSIANPLVIASTERVMTMSHLSSLSQQQW